jgi:hypothetical protein
MKFNEEIINTAILGTQKKELNPQILPKAIQDITTKLPKEDKEAFFFKSIALLNQYYKAGNLEVMTDLPRIPPAEAETLPYFDSHLDLATRKLLDTTEIRVHFWKKLLANCIEKRQIAHPKILVRLLNIGVKSKKASLVEMISKVIGNRGHWLIQFNEKWDIYQNTTSQKNLFESHSPAEIVEHLKAKRLENPKEAREILENQWKNLTAQNKILYVAILEENLSLEDEPFLRTILEQIHNKQLSSNKLVQDLRRTVVALLMRIPQSALSQEIWEKFKNYIVLDKGLIAFRLPKKADKFFCQEVMWEELALLDKSYNTTWYNDIEAWVYELLRLTNPNTLEEHLGLSKKDILHQFNNNEGLTRTVKKQTLALYTRALADACYLFKNAAWAKAWVDYFKDVYKIDENYISHLFYLHSLQEIELIYPKYIKLNSPDGHGLREVLANHPDTSRRWSESFSVYVLKELLEILTQDSYQTKDILHFLERIMDKLDLNALNRLPQNHPDEKIDNWRKSNYAKAFHEFMSLQELYKALQ